MKGLVFAAAAIGLIAAGVLWSPGLLPFEPLTARGLASGVLVGTAGSMAGFLLVARYRGADMRRFQSALFGGMLLRLGIFGLALALVLLRESVGLKGFLFGLIPAYVGFQSAELALFLRQASQRQDGDRGNGT